jgi:hypothetical protein
MRLACWITKARVRTRLEHLMLISGYANAPRCCIIHMLHSLHCFSTQSQTVVLHLSRLGKLHKCNKVQVDVRERFRLEAPDFYSDGLYKFVIQH